MSTDAMRSDVSAELYAGSAGRSAGMGNAREQERETVKTREKLRGGKERVNVGKE